METQRGGVPGRCHVVLLAPEAVLDLEAAPVDVHVRHFVRGVRYMVQPLQTRLATAYVFLCVFPPPRVGRAHTETMDMTYTGPVPVPRLHARGLPATRPRAPKDTSTPFPGPPPAATTRAHSPHPHNDGGAQDGCDDGAVGAVALAQIQELLAPVHPGGVTATAAPVYVGEPSVVGPARPARAEPPPAAAWTATPVSPDELVLTGDPSALLCRLAAVRLRPPDEGVAGPAAPRPAHPLPIRLVSPAMVTSLILPARVRTMSEVSQGMIRAFNAWLRGQLNLRHQHKAMARLTPADLDGVAWEWSRAHPGESVSPVRASGTELSPSQRGGAIWPTRVALADAVSCDVLWCSAWRRYWKDVHAGTSASAARAACTHSDTRPWTAGGWTINFLPLLTRPSYRCRSHPSFIARHATTSGDIPRVQPMKTDGQQYMTHYHCCCSTGT